MVELLLAFLKALPALVRIYSNLKEIFGDNIEKFLTDVDASTAMVVASKNESLSDEQKRAMRREALLKGRDLWSRIGK
jgi:hypothetical protein